MYSVVVLTESITDALKAKLNDITIRFKNSAETDEYSESKPHVYAWTYDDLIDGMPLNTPSVLVQLISVKDDASADYTIHICVCNPATQDKEITEPVQGYENLYKYKTGYEINTSTVRTDLYRACVMLAEQVLVAIKQISNDFYSFHDVQMDTPSPYMEDFPFCQCSVNFTAKKSSVQSEINTKVWDML